MVGLLVSIPGEVNSVHAAKKIRPPHINLQAIKASAAKASHITISYTGIRKTERKITEITIPSIVLPMGMDPSELVSTSIDRSIKSQILKFLIVTFN